MSKLLASISLGTLLMLGYASVGFGGNSLRHAHDCDEGGVLCTEVLDSIGYSGGYTGHDEPALLFYSPC